MKYKPSRPRPSCPSLGSPPWGAIRLRVIFSRSFLKVGPRPYHYTSTDDTLFDEATGLIK